MPALFLSCPLDTHSLQFVGFTSTISTPRLILTVSVPDMLAEKIADQIIRGH